MLTDERIIDLWSQGSSRPVLGRNKVIAYTRAVEAEVRKEQASRIAELERQLEDERKDSERYQFIASACDVSYMGREIESTEDLDAAIKKDQP